MDTITLAPVFENTIPEVSGSARCDARNITVKSLSLPDGHSALSDALPDEPARSGRCFVWPDIITRSFSGNSSPSWSQSGSQSGPQKDSFRTSSSPSGSPFGSLKGSFKASLLRFRPGDMGERCKQFEIDGSDLKVREKIGEGSLCDVWAGDCASRNGKVAIKKLRSAYEPQNLENKTQLMKELEFLSSDLEHPNIVAFYGVCWFKEAQVLTLVFEFMGGGTLESYFDSRSCEGKLHSGPIAQSVSWSLQLFKALEYLHSKEHPIIHRDLKPCNLMLSANYKTMKVKDFGVSKTADVGETILPRQPSTKQITTNRKLLRVNSANRYTGTARYMAPEVTTECLDYTTAVDIYSAALIMWFILEGERPWEKHHGHAAYACARMGKRPPVRRDGKTYPTAMANLICESWDHQPEKRPAAWKAIGTLNQIQDNL